MLKVFFILHSQPKKITWTFWTLRQPHSFAIKTAWRWFESSRAKHHGCMWVSASKKYPLILWCVEDQPHWWCLCCSPVAVFWDSDFIKRQGLFGHMVLEVEKQGINTSVPTCAWLLGRALWQKSRLTDPRSTCVRKWGAILSQAEIRSLPSRPSFPHPARPVMSSVFH